MRNLSTEGIILKKNDFGEHDRFVTFYSPTLGKTEAIAKHSRKLESPMMGHLEMFNICRFQLYKGNNSYMITQCQTVQTFRPLRDDFTKTLTAILMTEIFHKTTCGEEQSETLYRLVKKSLEHLCLTGNDFLCLESFKIKLLKTLGVLPEISRCSSCSHRWQEKDDILIDEDSHITCKDCRREKTCYRIIPYNIMKLINHLATTELHQLAGLKLNNDEAKTLKRFSDLFLGHFTGKEMVSEKIMFECAVF